MTFQTPRQPRSVVTVVVRLWPASRHSEQRRGFHYQATHVQTGEVAYFQSTEGLMGYLDRLSEQLTAPVKASSQASPDGVSPARKE